MCSASQWSSVFSQCTTIIDRTLVQSASAANVRLASRPIVLAVVPDIFRAVFLDRDGVLNRNVFYQDTSAYESPRSPTELVLTDGLEEALSRLVSAGYRLILISNQPNAAKGKCTRETLDDVHGKLVELLAEQGIVLDAALYCYHHPLHTGLCTCRKPEPGLLMEAAARFQLDLEACWMIGDRASDVLCGEAAGCQTAWIDNAEGQQPPSGNAADLVASSVPEAVAHILQAPFRNLL